MKSPRTILCCAVLALYALVALWAEAVHWRSGRRDETPEYNRVDLAARNLPPLAWSRRVEESKSRRVEESKSRRVEGSKSRRVEGSKSRKVDGSGNRLAEGESSRLVDSSTLPLSDSRTFHLLGTDSLGRDVALRLAQGTRIAFHVGVVTSCLAIPLGAFLGLVAGYFGRWIDGFLCALAAMVASIPSMLFILAIALVAGKGLLGVYLGIGVTTWVGVFRTVRGETMKHRSAGYVQAARVLGYGPWRILLRHIFPNVAHVVIIAFSTRFPAAVGTEVFMSFLGIGAQNEPSWGVMIASARVRLWTGQWWEGTFVTLAVFGLVLCFNLLGDVLRDTLDPTLRRSRA